MLRNSTSAPNVSILAMFAAASAMFLFVSQRLRSTNVKMLGFQTEKDSLIAELEASAARVAWPRFPDADKAVAAGGKQAVVRRYKLVHSAVA